MVFLATSIDEKLASNATGSKSFNRSYGRAYRAPLETWGFQSPRLSVYPSGAARATRPTAMLPFAPLTFSTIIGWPSTAVIRFATTRATVSAGPPGAYGTTMLMGRVG